jgi:hypothetical protein
MSLTNWPRLACSSCILSGYISCARSPWDPESGSSDSYDLENLVDLDYPADEVPISASELWIRWKNHQWKSNHRADHGERFQCLDSMRTRSVDITEHTLDGELFILLMRSRLQFYL